MDKRLIYPQYNANGERDVFVVTEDRRWLQKTSGAYHPDIQKYIQSAKPMPNLIQVLLTALGAHEYWGQNVNGDRFYEGALKNPGDDYGYRTFLSNANYFTHHVNKDPALAKGKVLATVWNDDAKRVELIVGINPQLDPDAAAMLDNGESLCFSMGARLPYDVCTVCGNKAKTRAEYCDHLRYQMNQIDPQSGILVGAVNPFPKFFDISRVMIPADKTAYMWEKIAHAANSPLSKIGSAHLAETSIRKVLEQPETFMKTASVSKSAEIKKQIIAISQPQAVEKLKLALTQVKHALDESSSAIPMEVFNGATSLDQCLSSMALLGISPTRSEAANLISLFTKEDGSVPPSQGIRGTLNIRLIKALVPYAESRSMYRPMLIRRIPLLEKKAAIVGDVAKGTADAGVAITKGVFAALGSLFGVTGSLAPSAERAVAQMPSGLAGLIAQHPVLAGILGAILLKSMSGPSRPVVDGNFTVADPTRGLYNNDWQRRFVDMQNRPVTVIKTGAAEKSESLVSPLTFLLMTVDLEKTAEEQRSWEMIADGLIQKLQSSELKEIVKSASRIAPNEAHNMSFVVPELGDLEIIKHVLNYAKEST